MQADSSPSFSSRDVNIYFQSARANINGNPTEHLVAFIKSAKKSLDCAIYDLKDTRILDAMKSASSRVKLRIAYDGGKDKTVLGGPMVDPKPSGTEQAIAQSGLSKYATAIHVSGGHLMHSKYIVKDGIAVWTGSGNWTHGGLDLQDNNFLQISSQQLATDYENNFESLLVNHIHPTRIKSANPTDLFSSKRAVKLGDAISITPYFSGGGTEEIENAVVALLKKAQKVRVIAMLISDPGILGALESFKASHRDIKGVLDPHEMKQVMHPSHGNSKTNPALFWFAHGDKRFVAAPSHAYTSLDKNDFMHNKVMILDDRIVITGSYNFSENAESNDENMLIVESKDIASAYTEYFDALYAQYSKHGAPLPPS